MNSYPEFFICSQVIESELLKYYYRHPKFPLNSRILHFVVLASSIWICITYFHQEFCM